MDLKIIKKIDLDLYNQKIVTVEAKQYDKFSRFILIACYNQGDFFCLDNAAHSAYVRYKKADELAAFNKCVITNDGKIIVELTEQMLAAPGNCSADLLIVKKETNSSFDNDPPVISNDGEIKTSGSIISTMNFRVHVLATPFENSEIESSYEFNALNELLTNATKDYQFVIEESKGYANEASNSAALSKSYAVGDSGVRAGENSDNSKYYSEQSKEYAKSWKGSLLPKGTISFSQLPASGNIAGHMYNINQAFQTDSRFKDGSGYSYPAGTNVYWTLDQKWDCLSGTLTKEVTQAEYDALSLSEKTNGTIYYIKDADNSLILEAGTNISITSSGTNKYMISAANSSAQSLPLASSATRGGVKTGYAQNGKNYPVQLNNEQMYVHVPWTDNNTTYVNATAHAAGLMSALDKQKLDELNNIVRLLESSINYNIYNNFSTNFIKLDTNNYTIYIMWGYETNGNGNIYTTTITFPTPFTKIPTVIASKKGDAPLNASSYYKDPRSLNESILVNNVTTTKFTLSGLNFGDEGGGGYFWFAIGV